MDFIDIFILIIQMNPSSEETNYVHLIIQLVLSIWRVFIWEDKTRNGLGALNVGEKDNISPQKCNIIAWWTLIYNTRTDKTKITLRARHANIPGVKWLLVTCEYYISASLGNKATSADSSYFENIHCNGRIVFR